MFTVKGIITKIWKEQGDYINFIAIDKSGHHSFSIAMRKENFKGKEGGCYEFDVHFATELIEHDDKNIVYQNIKGLRMR